MKRVHEVDLLPDVLRMRANAKIAASRNICYALLSVALVIGTSIHARLLETRASGQLRLLNQTAEQIARNERRAQALRKDLGALNRQIRLHQKVELPVDVSRVLAAVIDAMPESVSLEQVSIDANQLRRQGAPRAGAQNGPFRGLVAEVSGFARTDHDVADFVGSLERRRPFEAVSLDFSRQGEVNGHPAREFRMSFLIDFTRQYDVIDPLSAGALADVE